jgi:hypothetical protein
MYPFATPPIKLKLWQQIRGWLLITNHLHQSLWWANQKHWAPVKSYLLHSILQVHSSAAPFTRNGNLPDYAEPNRHVLDFLHQILLCRITYRAPKEMLLQSEKLKFPDVALHWHTWWSSTPSIAPPWTHPYSNKALSLSLCCTQRTLWKLWWRTLRVRTQTFRRNIQPKLQFESFHNLYDWY